MREAADHLGLAAHLKLHVCDAYALADTFDDDASNFTSFASPPSHASLPKQTAPERSLSCFSGWIALLQLSNWSGS